HSKLDSVTCVFPLFICGFSYNFISADSGRPTKTFTLEDYFNSSFNYKSYNMRWISGKYNYTKVIYVEGCFENNLKLSFQDTILHSLVMFQQLWRHSYTASYSIYDAYVWDFNVYIKPEATSPSVQVTTNGKKNAILNGIPDWVYEEEMFSSHGAMWWSPNGTFLAYAEFNDTQVQNIEFSWYGTGQYPETVVIPYPKAGATNPKVKLFVVSSANMSRVAEIVVPSSIGTSDHYLSSVTWITDSRVAVQWLMRIQNHCFHCLFFSCYCSNSPHLFCFQQYAEKSETGWVGQFSPLPPFFVEDSNNFYQVMSDKNKYKHIHYVTIVTNPITTGTWEVIYITKLTKDAIYFVSNEHGLKAGQRNLYKVALPASVQSPRQCLTCDLNVDRCQYNSGYFSLNASYYRWDCYGPGLPLFTLRDNRGPGSGDHNDLHTGRYLYVSYLQKNLRRSTIAVIVTVHGLYLWYQMILPPGFDKSKKYRLLIDVYAGPCSQKVDYRFRLNWATYLASAENIIVASIDGRGSGYQGDKLMHSIYKRLGTYEVEDQIETTRKFIDMGFIDKEKIAIWGWSYGGYVTSMVLGAGSGVFKCGMAVAPVSKWEYYDSIYTERYMNRPNSTVTSRAKNFKSVKYLLVHGTADDNVHFQQAAEISEALVEEQVDFEAMWYTDKDHGLDGAAHRHVYTHLSHFLLNCFENSSP
uniref:Dipeptidyl peptidase 4-like n=1 Tax=Scleropages formosus TaxID=113540 RepID=A0A8C9TJU4_SCLFO